MPYAHFVEICQKCGNKRNMRQLYICIKLTCVARLSKWYQMKDVCISQGRLATLCQQVYAICCLKFPEDFTLDESSPNLLVSYLETTTSDRCHTHMCTDGQICASCFCGVLATLLSSTLPFLSLYNRSTGVLATLLSSTQPFLSLYNRSTQPGRTFSFIYATPQLQHQQPNLSDVNLAQFTNVGEDASRSP